MNYIFNRLIDVLNLFSLNESSSVLQYFSAVFRFFGVLIRGWFPFRQIILALLPILLMLTSYCSQALTAKTRNVINGHAPYLTFDGGYTRATNTDELLGITLSDGTIITRATNNSSASNPIELPNAGETFADIGTFMPTDINADRVEIGTLISPPYNYAGDDDGDGDFSIGEASFYFTIYDRNNNRVARNETLNICNAPYRVKVSTEGGGNLSTYNGVPNRTFYGIGRATYYIKPKGEEEPRVCFARPDVTYSKGIYAGPSSEWDVYSGFIPQSTNSSSYHRNFPTTGANNLYFDLLIQNSGPLNWGDPITQGGITVTMTPDVTGETVRVTLTGPVAKPEQLVVNPSKQVDKPTLPQTFELVGRDNSGQAVVKYGFELKQWFVNRGNVDVWYDSGNNHTLWCNNIGYRLSSIADLTNAVYGDYIGATPSSPGNYYQRRIGAGLFTEWGVMSNYAGANFNYEYAGSKQGYYFTKDGRGVNQGGGSLGSLFRFYGVCVSP